MTVPSQRIIDSELTRLVIGKAKSVANVNIIERYKRKLRERAKPVLVPTGVKAYFPKDEVLYLFNRSSNPLKLGLYLANGTGVIDSDYYDNPSNDGQLFAQFINLGWYDYTVHKGDRIMQGVFEPYLLADSDHARGVRKGGLGSTGKE